MLRSTEVGVKTSGNCFVSRKRNPICGFKTARFIICEDIIDIIQIEGQREKYFCRFKNDLDGS